MSMSFFLCGVILAYGFAELPHNILLIDTAVFERSLFSAGLRHLMPDPKTNKPRAPGSTLSLENLLRSLPAEIPCQLHNSGNDALMCLFALQKLLDPENTKVPTKVRPTPSAGGPPVGVKALNRIIGGPGLAVTVPAAAPVVAVIPPIIIPPGFTPGQVNADADYFDTGNEFGQQVRRLPGRQKTSLTANSNPGFQTHPKRGAKTSGRNVDALGGSMRSMALR